MEFSGEVDEIGAMQCILRVPGNIIAAMGTEFVGPFDKGGIQATLVSCFKIILVCRNQHDLVRAYIEYPGDPKVGVGMRFVFAEYFGAKDAVPWQSRPFCHIGEQSEVAV